MLLDCKASFVSLVNTHLPGLPLRGFLWYRGTRTTRAMAFLRTNCRTTTATVLTATAGATLSLRVLVLLVPTAITRRRRRVPSTMSTSPKQLDTGKPCDSCQDTPHEAASACFLSQASEKWPLTSGNSLHLCTESFVGEIEDDTGGTVLRPSPSTGRPRR